jgi:MFS family permease
MFKRMSLGKDRTNFKLSTANVILVANAFVWYYLAFSVLKTLLNNINPANANASTPDNILIIGINTAAIAVSALLGSFLVDKFKKREVFLYVWISLGIVLSLVPLGLNVLNLGQLGVVSLIFGLYFGLGMPATMGYHSSFTKVEGRAKIGGLAFLIIATTSAIASVLISNSLFVTCLVLAFVRVIGLGVFHFMRGKEEPYKETNKAKYRSILTSKPFIFYFIPWLMFTLVNYLTLPVLRQNVNNYESLAAAENIVIAIVAVVTGFIADKWGRKRLIIVGFIVLGIGYAVIGLTTNVYGSIIYTVLDGVAWGIFFVLFLLTLWGDLAQTRNSDKFFFLGALPYISSYFMQLLFAPYLQGILPTAIFSFAAFFLFLAVLPLLYAPETLPEKVMKDRDLKSYVEKAKKKAEKESGKENKKEEITSEQNDEKKSAPVNSKEYEDAAKLAEKYY